MNASRKIPSVYVKMKVLGAIDSVEGRTIRERIGRVAQMSFVGEDNELFQFTPRTIETWQLRYKKYGVTSMQRNERSDAGKRRKIVVEDVLEAIEQVRPVFRNKAMTKAGVYRACIERGLLRRENISLTTFFRLAREYELLKPESQVKSKKRRAFSKPHANMMWQADTMHGPHARDDDGNPCKTYLIAFIDDASRIICHGEFFFEENIANLIAALRSAFYKRGLPERIYVDNGSIYTSREINLICARVGCILSHAPVRDGAAKGKIERFFRTARQQFLSRQLDLSSLQKLNSQFTSWVEEEYHAREHSTLGMKPLDRFGVDLSRIRFLHPNEHNDELFYLEETRHVKKDNTFSFKSRRYEAPRDLREKTVQVRFDRRNPHPPVVYYKSERLGRAVLLDRVANDRVPAPKGEDA